MRVSSSKENYLKSIFHLQEAAGVVTTNALARELDTRAASVTDMLKKLKTQKLLLYERYQGFRLSPEGRRLAIQIIRKHRLWECFLVEKLRFGWEEVHEVAEELEHISSAKLVDRLDEFLGYPKTDPHGDPIPDSEGRWEPVEQIPLKELPVGATAKVGSIAEQSAEMLELVHHKGLVPGARVKVSRRFDYDQSLEVEVGGTGPVAVSEQLARNILVLPDKKQNA